MNTPFRNTLNVALALATAVAATGQEPKRAAIKASEPHITAVQYPRDKQKAVAVVGTKTLTLGELIAHIDARHYPGFEELVRKQPTFQRYLQSDLMAPWVRQFADIEALRQQLGDTYVDPVALEEAQSASLKASFETYLGNVVEHRRQTGRPTELTLSSTRLTTPCGESKMI